MISVIAWLWLPLSPGSAWFLRKPDRDYAVERMRLDNAMYVQHSYADSGVEKDRLTRRDMIETAKDWKLWYVLFFNILASVPGQAFSVFLPLVVAGLGYSSIEANLVSASKDLGRFNYDANSSDVCATIRLWRCWSIHLCVQLRSQVSHPTLFTSMMSKRTDNIQKGTRISHLRWPPYCTSGAYHHRNCAWSRR